MTPAAADIPSLPARDQRGHKGTFGVVTVLGGQAGATPMIGSAALTGVAALRVGAGLLKIVAPAPVLPAILTVAPSATGIALAVEPDGSPVAHLGAETLDRALERCSCLAIGPGLGMSRGAAALSLRALGQQSVPVVADADALNAIAGMPDLARDMRARAVLTPHPGEFARIAAPLGVTAEPTLEHDRPRAAEQLAQRLGCVVVLKGAGTVVSDGQRTWVNDAADHALATAGTGDVLTGAIAGLIAQHDGALDLFDCARIAVVAHAHAARLWREKHKAPAGLLAMELADLLPEALASSY